MNREKNSFLIVHFFLFLRHKLCSVVHLIIFDESSRTQIDKLRTAESRVIVIIGKEQSGSVFWVGRASRSCATKGLAIGLLSLGQKSTLLCTGLRRIRISYITSCYADTIANDKFLIKTIQEKVLGKKIKIKFTGITLWPCKNMGISRTSQLKPTQ